MVAFAMFLIFKKIKALLPSILGTALNREPVPATVSTMSDNPDTDSENEDEFNNMSNIIELDEEDIDVDDINSDDEIVLNKTSSDSSDESADDSVVEEPVEEPVEEELKPMKKTKSLKPRKGKTIKI